MAITYDAGSSNFSGGYTAGPTSKSWSHTCTGTNLILWLAVGIWRDVAGTGSVTSCTYDGVALTKYVEREAAGSTMYTALYYLIAPATGAKTLAVTVTGATDAIKFVASSYSGVVQTSFLDANAYGDGYGTTATATVTTVADNSELVSSILHFGTGAITKGASQTEIAKDNGNSTAGGSSYQTTPKTPAGSTALTWTWTGSGDWSMVAASFKPDTSSSTPTPRFRSLLGVGY